MGLDDFGSTIYILQRITFAFWTSSGGTKSKLHGEGGIRTHGTLSSTPVFKTGAINRSATSPKCLWNLENFPRKSNFENCSLEFRFLI